MTRSETMEKAAELQEEIGKLAETIRTADPENREYLNYLIRTKYRLERQLQRMQEPPLKLPKQRTLPSLNNYDN